MKKILKILGKILKWLGIVIGSLLLLVIILILLLRTPWAQQKITNYATSYVSDKTGTEVSIDRLFVTFRGNLQLEGVYLEGLQQDTLLYSRSLEAGVGVRALISGDIAISRIHWEGVRANVVRGSDSSFNFQFLIDSLAGGGTTPADTAAADTATSPPPRISVGPVNLRHIRITYLDSISGMDAMLNLGLLQLTTDEIDLDSMRFMADELHLANTSARVLQFKQPPPSEDTTSSPMPYLAWQEISLENIQLEYETQPDTMLARANIGLLRIGASALALDEQNISVESFGFYNSNIYARLPAPAKADTAATAPADTTAPEAFEWPGWQVDLQNLDLDSIKIALHMGPESRATTGQFDPQHLLVGNLKINVPRARLADEEASLELEELSLREGGPNGFLLRRLSFDARLSGQRASIDNLVLNTRRSRLETSLQLRYSSLQAWMEDPLNETNFEVNIPGSQLAVQDAYYFQDSLRYMPSVQALAQQPVRLSGEISGHYGDLRISELSVAALRNTRLKINGRITGMPDTNNVQVQIPLISVYTTKADLANFVDTATSLNPPSYVRLRASVRGNVAELKNELRVQTPKGDIMLDAVVTNILSQRPGYRGSLDVDELQLGNILRNPNLGLLAMEMEFNGAGQELDDLDLQSDISFEALEYQGYNYRDLALNLAVKDGRAEVTATHKDENLDMELTADALLDPERMVANLHLNLEGADLHDLNFSGNPLKLAFNMRASFEGTPEDFISSVAMGNIIVIGQDEASYRADTLFLGLENAPDTASLDLLSSTITGHLHSNSSLTTTMSSMQNFLYKAVGRDTTDIDTVYQDLAMDAYFKIVDTRMLHDVLLPNLERMDSLTLDLEFAPANDILRLDVRAPDIVYNDIEIQGLGLDFDATSDSLGLDFGFDQLLAGPVEMFQTRLGAHADYNQGTAYFSVLDQEEEEVTYLSAAIDRQEEMWRISLSDEKLILNRNSWKVPEDNEILLAENGPIFHNFRLSRNRQELSFESREEQAQLQMNFRNFALQALLSIFNAEEPLLAGYMNGSVKLLDLDNNPAFAADLSIDSLAALGKHVGVLQLDADNRTAELYQGQLQLNGPQIDLQVQGNYNIGGTTPQADVSVNLNKLGLPLIRDFLPEQIKQASGNLAANLSLEGPADDIAYKGELRFNDVRIVPTMLGTPFKMPNEKISLDNDGLYFDQFAITDASGDKLRIKGEVGTKDLMNPTFNLQLNATNFEVLDVKEADNELFYGKAVVNLRLDVSGDMELPVVDARVKLLKATDVYYAVPASQAVIDERQGLVRFANMKDTLAVLTADEATGNTITGYDISARVLADPETRFTIFIDPRSNDRITVAGEANLRYNLYPNGNMELMGEYILSNGAYKLSLYELVRKEFKIIEGSRVVWNGDPMGAQLDITAMYRTRTAPVDLMAERLAGADQSTINRYKQQLPFEVLLYVDGSISSPEISFGLDMPDDAKAAIGGNVYSRVQQLSENNNELNKQVFSLIVFDRFLPSNVAASDEGGATEGLARSSASRLLTNQLNKLSDRYIEGVELNFNVDSYTDYQTGSAQQRTDLNISLRKSFLDDRVVVEVGSQVGVEGQENRSQVLSDVSVEYLLTEDGRWRVKGFQENQYQGIIEGQVRVTGLGLLFSREFDNWRDLFGADEEDENAENDFSLPETGTSEE